MSFWHNDYALQELRLTMHRLTRAYAQFYWNSNRDVLLSRDTEHHTDIIESLRKKDADEAIRLASEKRRTQLCGILMEYQRKNSGRGSQPDTFSLGDL